MFLITDTEYFLLRNPTTEEGIDQESNKRQERQNQYPCPGSNDISGSMEDSDKRWNRVKYQDNKY